MTNKQTLTDRLIAKFPIAAQYKQELLQAEKNFLLRVEQLHPAENRVPVVEEALLQFAMQKQRGVARPFSYCILCKACEKMVNAPILFWDSVVPKHVCAVPPLWQQLDDYGSDVTVDYESESLEDSQRQMSENLPVIQKREEAKRRYLEQKYFGKVIEGVKA